jgi:small subunit ribosomal protein S7
MRGNNFKRRITPADPLYNSKQVTKFINGVMRDGKRSIAAKLVYDAFEIIEKDHSKNPLTVFEKALNNVGPKMEVRPRRVGGASYQVPVEVRGNRREALAIRWLIDSANKRSNKEYKCFEKKLAAELLDASESQGNAIKKREDVLRAAEANKAFAHFRW